MADEDILTESILDSIKATLDLQPGFNAYDQVIMLHINSMFMVLDQVGVGPPDGFSITDRTATWSDFISRQPNVGKPFNIVGVKTYIGLRVRMIFDPPQHGPTEEAFQKTANELEWRLKAQAEEAMQYAD